MKQIKTIDGWKSPKKFIQDEIREPYNGELETLQYEARNAYRMLSNLIQILVDKNLLTTKQVSEIAGSKYE